MRTAHRALDVGVVVCVEKSVELNLLIGNRGVQGVEIVHESNVEALLGIVSNQVDLDFPGKGEEFCNDRVSNVEE